MAFKGNMQQDHRKWELGSYLSIFMLAQQFVFEWGQSFRVGLQNSQEQQLTIQKKQKLSDVWQKSETQTVYT